MLLSCHVRVSEWICSCLNVKELLARSRRHIWSLSDTNGIRTHSHLVCKRILNHLARLKLCYGWCCGNPKLFCEIVLWQPDIVLLLLKLLRKMQILLRLKVTTSCCKAIHFWRLWKSWQRHRGINRSMKQIFILLKSGKHRTSIMPLFEQR